MEDDDFEGTLILEKLAEINQIENFFDAVDADNFTLVRSLLRRARVDAESIAMVLKKMDDAK